VALRPGEVGDAVCCCCPAWTSDGSLWWLTALLGATPMESRGAGSPPSCLISGTRGSTPTAGATETGTPALTASAAAGVGTSGTGRGSCSVRRTGGGESLADGGVSEGGVSGLWSWKR